MKNLLILLMTTCTLFAQLEVYTNIAKTNNSIAKNQFFQISLDIIKQMQKTLGKNNAVKIYPAKKYNKDTKNTIFIGTTDSFTQDNFKALNIFTTEKYTLYGNKHEIYYIDTLKDAKSVKKIYCKKYKLFQNIFKNNKFHNISYIKKRNTGLKNLLKYKQRLWLMSNWKIKKATKKYYKKIKPIHTVTTKETHIMLPNNINDKEFQSWKNALTAMQTNGTLKKIVAKWEKKLNLNLELQANGAITVVD